MNQTRKIHTPRLGGKRERHAPQILYFKLRLFSLALPLSFHLITTHGISAA
jgi:hypothetical protein